MSRQPLTPILKALLIATLSAIALFVSSCGGAPGDEPQLFETQATTVGIVISNPASRPSVDSFKQSLGSLGFNDGDNILFKDIVLYTPDQSVADINDLVDESARDDVDIWALTSATIGGAAHNSLNRVQDLVEGAFPIIAIGASGDPVATGYADSIERPGGNVTGILLPNADSKRFELFLEMLPEGVEQITLIYNSAIPGIEFDRDRIRSIAPDHSVELRLFNTPTGAQLETFDAVRSEAPPDTGGIFLLKVWATSPQWYEFGYQSAIPVSHDSPPELASGPLMGYGPGYESMGKQAARMADQIISGIDVGDLPIENAELFLTISASRRASTWTFRPQFLNKRMSSIELILPQQCQRPAKTKAISVTRKGITHAPQQSPRLAATIQSAFLCSVAICRMEASYPTLKPAMSVRARKLA